MNNKQNEKIYKQMWTTAKELVKWKVVIKQAPSGLEEIRLLLLCFAASPECFLTQNSQQPTKRTVIIYF